LVSNKRLDEALRCVYPWPAWAERVHYECQLLELAVIAHERGWHALARAAKRRWVGAYGTAPSESRDARRAYRY
jgi:hypothetical protein